MSKIANVDVLAPWLTGSGMVLELNWYCVMWSNGVSAIFCHLVLHTWHTGFL